jgi:hypothetical protein
MPGAARVRQVSQLAVTKLAYKLAQMARHRAPYGGARVGASQSTGKERWRECRRMNLRGYFRVGLATTFNILAYGVTLGHYVWLEGRVHKGVFLNWGRRYRYEPEQFEKPTSDAEIAELV